MPLPNNTNYVGPPSKEEVERENRQQLSEKGCAVCGEDDPDKLHRETVKYPDCQFRQTPPGAPWHVVCEDHTDEMPSFRERAINRAHELNDRPADQRASTIVAVVYYECGNYEYAKRTVEYRDSPQTSIRCACGAEIDDVVYLDGDE